MGDNGNDDVAISHLFTVIFFSQMHVIFVRLVNIARAVQRVRHRALVVQAGTPWLEAFLIPNLFSLFSDTAVDDLYFSRLFF